MKITFCLYGMRALHYDNHLKNLIIFKNDVI